MSPLLPLLPFPGARDVGAGKVTDPHNVFAKDTGVTTDRQGYHPGLSLAVANQDIFTASSHICVYLSSKGRSLLVAISPNLQPSALPQLDVVYPASSALFSPLCPLAISPTPLPLPPGLCTSLC